MRYWHCWSPLWHACLVYSREPFCSYDLHRMWFVVRHQPLATFQRNAVKNKGLKFIDINRLVCCNHFFSKHFKSTDCHGHSSNFHNFYEVKSRWIVVLWLDQSFSCIADGVTFSPRISWYLTESILSCSFPVPEEEKQPQSISKPLPCFTVGLVLVSEYASHFLFQTTSWSTDVNISCFD